MPYIRQTFRGFAWPQKGRLVVMLFSSILHLRAFTFVIICNYIASNQPFTKVDILASGRAKWAI